MHLHLGYHDSSSLVYISVYALVARYILAALDICFDHVAAFLAIKSSPIIEKRRSTNRQRFGIRIVKTYTKGHDERSKLAG